MLENMKKQRAAIAQRGADTMEIDQQIQAIEMTNEQLAMDLEGDPPDAELEPSGSLAEVGSTGAPGVEAAGFGSTGAGPAGVGAAGFESTGAAPTGVGAAGFGSTEAGPTGVGAAFGSTEAGSTGVGAAEFGPTGVGAFGSTGAGPTGIGAAGFGGGGTPSNIPELAGCDLGAVNLVLMSRFRGQPIRTFKIGWGTFLLVKMGSEQNTWFMYAKPKDYPEVDVKSLKSVESDRPKRNGLRLLRLGLPAWNGVEMGDLTGMNPAERKKGERFKFTLTTSIWEQNVVTWEVRGPLEDWEAGMSTKNVHQQIWELAQKAVERANAYRRSCGELN